MSVRFSPQADEDIWRIEQHISQFNPTRAETFSAELVNACLAIGDMPLAWPLVPRYEHFGYRRKPFKNHLIFYEILDEDRNVAILHVIHAARDYERMLFPSE